MAVSAWHLALPVGLAWGGGKVLKWVMRDDRLGVVAGGRQGVGWAKGFDVFPDHGGSLDVADALTLS